MDICPHHEVHRKDDGRQTEQNVRNNNYYCIDKRPLDYEYLTQIRKACQKNPFWQTVHNIPPFPSSPHWSDDITLRWGDLPSFQLTDIQSNYAVHLWKTNQLIRLNFIMNFSILNSSQLHFVFYLFPNLIVQWFEQKKKEERLSWTSSECFLPKHSYNHN